MKARFQTKKLVRSNTTKEVYFNDLESALNLAREQRKIHPRTKKLNGLVFDNENKVCHRI